MPFPCECPLPALLWQWYQAASLRSPFSQQLSLKPPRPVTFPCGMALVPCAHPSPPGGSFYSSWAIASSPPNRHPFYPLHLTWALICLGLSPHSCMEALFTLLRFQLSLPTIHKFSLHLARALASCIGCPFTSDALLHGHPLGAHGHHGNHGQAKFHTPC